MDNIYLAATFLGRRFVSIGFTLIEMSKIYFVTNDKFGFREHKTNLAVLLPQKIYV